LTGNIGEDVSLGMNCAFDALLFDLGGTLIYFEGDKGEVIHQANRALARAVQELGYDISQYVLINAYETRLQRYFGHRDEDLVEYTTRRVLKELLTDHGYPNAPDEDVRAALRAMYEVFEANWHVEEDALLLLKTLKEHECKLGLISNAADDDDVQRQVDNAGLRPYLDAVFTSSVVGMRKPHPKIFKEATQALGVTDLSRVLMVGDRLNADIAGAKKLGMKAVWITRRVNNPVRKAAVSLWQPDAKVTSLVELMEWMKSYKL
jgi:2-haloalkanoic acid dehalogenase type II